MRKISIMRSVAYRSLDSKRKSIARVDTVDIVVGDGASEN
jgi:hypothetical protein